MKTNSTQIEVLLVTSSNYLSKEICGRDDNNSGQLSPEEKLEESCWNGLIKEIIPELFEEKDKEGLFLWEIRKGSSFLELDLGDYPEEKEKYFSLYPDQFLANATFN